MNNFFLNSLPPQSVTIYRLLVSDHPLTAKEIGVRVNILPNAVYRAIKQLLELGLVKESKDYPVKYEAESPDAALELYSLVVRRNFQEVFPSRIAVNGKKALNITFIQNREQLRENTDRDVAAAEHSVNFFVSGHEVPAETMLTYKTVIAKGVKIRMLVQRLDSNAKEMFHNWEKIGAFVRYYPTIEARIFIIDKHIVYFTSYNPQDKDEAIGMRFDYTPYAKIMDELFEQRWKRSKPIR